MESRPVAPAPPALRQRRAVIDVGTNSVKLLVGDVAGNDVEAVLERGIQTRLGENLFADTNRRLLPPAIERTAETVADFHQEALGLGATSVRLLATAAAREARNAEDLRQSLEGRTGLRLEVLAGAVEADMAFRGVCTNAATARGPVLVTDLGGGSTEFIVGIDGVRRFGRSFPLGAVRLLEALQVPQHPGPDDLRRCRDHVDGLLAAEVRPALSPALDAARSGDRALQYVAVGGTAIILARMARAMVGFDRAQIEATRLSAEALTDRVERLWALPLARRREVPGLPPERADVILTGAVVHERIVREFALTELTPGTRGLRFAALLDPS